MRARDRAVQGKGARGAGMSWWVAHLSMVPVPSRRRMLWHLDVVLLSGMAILYRGGLVPRRDQLIAAVAMFIVVNAAWLWAEMHLLRRVRDGRGRELSKTGFACYGKIAEMQQRMDRFDAWKRGQDELWRLWRLEHGEPDGSHALTGEGGEVIPLFPLAPGADPAATQPSVPRSG